ncbi:MAG: alanyl-tRNA editing protein [Candidatus Micrarchaeaceae archaeon]
MTEKIYLKDSYAKELDAQIVGSAGNEVMLDRTIFYPGGGGQPFDTGTMFINGNAYKVLEVKKDAEDIIHALSSAPSAGPGSAAHCVLDWQKRYAYMRYHTALHIIDGVIARKHNAQAMSTGGQIFYDRARMDFDMPALNREILEQIIRDANAIVNEGRRVYARELPREEAIKIPNLARTEPGKKLIQRLDSVRIVEIEGLDAQADGGTHVANTKEVGSISIVKFENKGSHSKRIEIRLSEVA